jgi:hypothetical protein
MEAGNSCGCDSTFKSIQSARSSPVSPVLVYPNPVDDILYIEIDPQVFAGSRSRIPLTYDFRLYDTYGIQVRRTSISNGKTQFDMSNLPKGMYFLHIYDGVEPHPEMRQIVKN